MKKEERKMEEGEGGLKRTYFFPYPFLTLITIRGLLLILHFNNVICSLSGVECRQHFDQFPVEILQSQLGLKTKLSS